MQTEVRANQMTDHRATDLVHGHFGEFSYDIIEEQWSFSQDVNRSRFELSPLQSFHLLVSQFIVFNNFFHSRNAFLPRFEKHKRMEK